MGTGMLPADIELPTMSQSHPACGVENFARLQMPSTLAPPTERIAPDVKLGRNVRIFSFTNLYGCEIGDDVKIGTFVEIQKGAKIGSRCKISSHTFICEGVTLEDEFLWGTMSCLPTTVIRARRPTANCRPRLTGSAFPTLVKRGASIGSGAVLLCGITIGENAMIGAGSVVTKDVPAGATVAGNPARIVRPRSQKTDGTNLLQPVNPLDHPDWDARLTRRPDFSFFHGAAWTKVLVETYGFTPVWLAAEPFAVAPDGSGQLADGPPRNRAAVHGRVRAVVRDGR